MRFLIDFPFLAASLSTTVVHDRGVGGGGRLSHSAHALGGWNPVFEGQMVSARDLRPSGPRKTPDGGRGMGRVAKVSLTITVLIDQMQLTVHSIVRRL